MSISAEQLHKVEVCDHITCLIDLLAQRSHLADWDVMPADDVLTDKMTDAIHKSAGVVWHYRTQFEEYARQFNIPAIPPDLIATLSSERQEFYYRVRNTGLRSQQFSDTFVLYAPLQTANRERTILPVFGVLFGACLTMLESLASGVPVRGGVDIGVGLELTESNFYGPTLAAVHRLESEVAEYPRIVACERMIHSLDAIIAGTSHFVGDNEMLNDINARCAKECRALFALDDDGQWIVDFLGAPACKIFESLPVDQEKINNYRKAARDFAHTQLDHHQKSNDDKLAQRYSLLCEYFRSRGFA